MQSHFEDDILGKYFILEMIYTNVKQTWSFRTEEETA